MWVWVAWMKTASGLTPVAAPIAAFLAACVYMFLKRCNFTESIKPGVSAARKIVMIFFILMFTYGLAECFMATGVGAALIRICKAGGMTGRSVAPVALFVTALLSFSIGSSWGAFAAAAPISRPGSSSPSRFSMPASAAARSAFVEI